MGKVNRYYGIIVFKIVCVLACVYVPTRSSPRNLFFAYVVSYLAFLWAANSSVFL